MAARHVLYEVMHNAQLSPPMTMQDSQFVPVENPEQYKPEELMRQAIGIFEDPQVAAVWASRLETAAEAAGKREFWDFPIEEIDEEDLTKIEILMEEFANMARGQ